MGGRRSRGTPRIANRLLRRVRDFAEVRAEGFIDRRTAHDGLALFGVDSAGSTRSTAPSSAPCASSSVAVRWASRPSPSA